MLCKFCLVLVCLFAFAAEVHNKPAPIITSTTTGVQSCYTVVCPEDTYACEKVARISEDKKNVVGVIRCLGLKGTILKNITTSEPNPFGPEAQYHHYSYSSAYEIHIDSENTGEAGDTTSKVQDSDKESKYEPSSDDVEVF